MVWRTPASAARMLVRFSYVSLLDAAALGIRVEAESVVEPFLSQIGKLLLAAVFEPEDSKNHCISSVAFMGSLLADRP